MEVRVPRLEEGTEEHRTAYESSMQHAIFIHPSIRLYMSNVLHVSVRGQCCRQTVRPRRTPSPVKAE